MKTTTLSSVLSVGIPVRQMVKRLQSNNPKTRTNLVGFLVAGSCWGGLFSTFFAIQITSFEFTPRIPLNVALSIIIFFPTMGLLSGMAMDLLITDTDRRRRILANMWALLIVVFIFGGMLSAAVLPAH